LNWGWVFLWKKSLIKINCGRWSESEAVIFPDTVSKSSVLIKILSMRVEDLSLTLVGCNIRGRKLWENICSIKLAVPGWLKMFNKLKLKSPAKNTGFLSVAVLLKSGSR